jgi:hypothetical protein
MEHRVKCMLLLLGEEADSFSKRAEMYYKRRPEVITQVEEVYRAYKALADRYDIMSGELHKANHTIATAFPDQVQYAMLEEEEDNIPKAFTPVDPRKIHKSTVDGLMMKKNKKNPGRSMDDGGEKTTPLVAVSKENAREEISRLQKAILVMQTEKEFIKSSYESGIAKYWDLEKEINDMQEQACHFQDKFDESAVIEDDEARALMTATALKSCEDTIVRLQEQRKASAQRAVGESERVRVLRDKFEAIMNKHGRSLPAVSLEEERNTRKNHCPEETMESVHVKQEVAVDIVADKIKEHFERGCDISIAQVTERIDEVVNTVVDLELMVSSQTSQIDRLCQENKELESSLQSLEDGSADELTEKLIRQAEEELVRAQALESSFHKDESTIRSNFVEAISRFHDVSELLLSPVCDSAHTSHDVPESSMEEIAEQPHAEADNALVAAKSESSSCMEMEQQLDVAQDKISCDDHGTSLLEDAKRKLAEMEQKNQDCLNEIRALREQITSCSCSRRGHRRRPSISSDASISLLKGPTLSTIAENASPLQDKFRRDIDTLLDNNLELLMKFSSSLQRVQEFQSKHDGLQHLIKDQDGGKQDGTTEKQLRAFKTELQVWSEQNAMLRGELQCRFASLCDIQEEITAALDDQYQAAKFQGEILNMQQENNRVSDELQAGLDHIKGLHAEVEQALAKLHKSVSLPPQQAGDDGGGDSSSPAHGGSSSNLGLVPSNKSNVPLQSFLFPAKPTPAKPKKTSLLARVTPVLPKQPVDMRFLAKLPR